MDRPGRDEHCSLAVAMSCSTAMLVLSGVVKPKAGEALRRGLDLGWFCISLYFITYVRCAEARNSVSAAVLLDLIRSAGRQ